MILFLTDLERFGLLIRAFFLVIEAAVTSPIPTAFAASLRAFMGLFLFLTNWPKTGITLINNNKVHHGGLVCFCSIQALYTLLRVWSHRQKTALCNTAFFMSREKANSVTQSGYKFLPESGKII